MSFFDKIKNVFGIGEGGINNPEFEQHIDFTRVEHFSNNGNYWNISLADNKGWEIVKNWPGEKKVEFIVWLVAAIYNYYKKAGYRWNSEEIRHQNQSIRNAFLKMLFKHKLVLSDEDVETIYEAFNRNSSRDRDLYFIWPLRMFLNQLFNQRKNQQIQPLLRTTLEKVKGHLNRIEEDYDKKERMKLIEKIDELLFLRTENPDQIKVNLFLDEDRFAKMANSQIESRGQSEKNYWYKLLSRATKASGSKPSEKYLDESKKLITDMGVDVFRKVMQEWMLFLISLKEEEQQHTNELGNGQVYRYSTYEYISEVNLDTIKGLVWICSHFHDKTTIQAIAALAERSFRKIPNKGPTAAALGNACLFVLFKSKGLDGIGQLSRLKLVIKQASTQSIIEKYLREAATYRGVSIDEIQDMAIEDCGLVEGKFSQVIDDYKAELIITGVGKTDIKWYKPDGSLQKSIPASIKEKQGEKLKKLKARARQVEQTLVAQRDRLDRLFRNDRKIEWTSFEENYLNHGLMSYLANSIIWNFYRGELVAQAIRIQGKWVNQYDEEVSIENVSSVSLWHPVQASLEEIRSWRFFFTRHQITQPLKQAYREVYLLTDAEVNTITYSNRMAAHILRQHQFNSLAKLRGWRYTLIGSFDNGVDNDKASLILPEYNLRAEYWVTGVVSDQVNDTGIWNYISTDQVRFINTVTDSVVELIEVRALVFSEVMRDVDLFVGVASVANDPTWQDSGGLPVYRDYWSSYSFGELSEIAKNRKEILAGLIGRLKIRDVSSIKDRFLVVEGKLRTYKIHIGSTNILMEPNDQYLCIVPDRNQKDHTQSIFLPFEGDTGLSIILSKAFLLAEDDKIKDPTIVSQIKSK